MHRSLRIHEILVLIFEFVAGYQFHSGPQQRKKTLFSLTKTCHLFNSPALDILWRDLYSLGPLLHVFPVVSSSADDTQWLTFRKYATRVKTIHCSDERISTQAKQNFLSSIQCCPESYLPLLPNLIKLEWRELSLAPREDSSISLLRYFAGLSVTTISLCFVRWLACSPEVAVIADLPRLCPSVTSFTIDIHLSWDHEPAEEVGMMVAQWPRLRTLRTRALAQSVMDQLFTGRVLETLSVDYDEASPVYVGSISDTVRELSLSADRPRLCMRFLESVHASPDEFILLIGMNEGKEENAEELFRLLPRRLDRHRLQSLKILPRPTIVGIPLCNTLELRASHVSALIEFTALRELDLDFLCTAHISDADYIRMAMSLTQLRSLKLGTANPSILRPCPAASIGALIALLKHCRQLETLHIVFDGSIPYPGCWSLKNGELEASTAALACQEWEASNRRITKLCVGCSPILDAAVGIMASHFKLMMPCLVEIEHKGSVNWKAVQNMLELCKGGMSGRYSNQVDCMVIGSIPRSSDLSLH